MKELKIEQVGEFWAVYRYSKSKGEWIILGEWPEKEHALQDMETWKKYLERCSTDEK